MSRRLRSMPCGSGCGRVRARGAYRKAMATSERKAAALARKTTATSERKAAAAPTAAVIARGSHQSAGAARGHGAALATAPSTAGLRAGTAVPSKSGFGAAAPGSAMAVHGAAAASGAADLSSIYGISSTDGSLHGKGGLTRASPIWSADGGSPISPAYRRPASWDPLWDNNSHPPGGFMSLINNQPYLSQNSHFVGSPSHYAPFKAPRSVDISGSFVSVDAPQHNLGGNSSEEVEILPDHQAVEVDSNNENVRTEKRIMWTPDEDEKLMSAWLKNSTDSTVGADRNNEHYWGDVVKSYNMTISSRRQRNSKQAKDRWHKINRWTDLYECAYLKARRVFTSGYSNEMWIDAADKFYLEDNKKAKLGPFVLKNVWKICREVPKWKTYNEELKNARKRKSYHTEGEVDENDDIEEMPERPIGQKAAKKAALAAKGKSKGTNLDDDGKSKESAIDVEKLDKFSKIQEELNANRMKVLELQQKLSSEKLETTRLAQLTAKDTLEAKRIEKESNMMHAYNTLISQDTSAMSDEEKAERVAAMKCFRKTLFPEMS